MSSKRVNVGWMVESFVLLSRLFYIIFICTDSCLDWPSQAPSSDQADSLQFIAKAWHPTRFMATIARFANAAVPEVQT